MLKNLSEDLYVSCYDGICLFNDGYKCTCKMHNISPNDDRCKRKIVPMVGHCFRNISFNKGDSIC